MSLQKQIAEVLNKASAEHASDTPDFILAEYLIGCLAAFNRATNDRDKFYGRKRTAPPSITFIPPSTNS